MTASTTGDGGATWGAFSSEAPELAAQVRGRLSARAHLTMATLRRDGSPRISGTEIRFRDDDLLLAGMTGARRFTDLRRDPRLALHSGSDDPPSWTADAKVSGLAVEITDPAAIARVAAGEPSQGPFELFRILVTEATVVRLDDSRSHLVIESWRPGEGMVRFLRE